MTMYLSRLVLNRHAPTRALSNLSPGDQLVFALRANATQDRSALSRLDPSERRGKSRRVDVVMNLLRDVPADDRAAQRMPLDIAVEDYSVLSLGRSRRRRGMTHGVLDLSGRIEITDPEKFLPALASGFGRAKAWGCGLMLIRRDR